MDWPSKRVPKGGMFHSKKVTYSKETHDLLKLLMEEQKMTMFQRNKVNYHLRNGNPLPIPKPIISKQPIEDELALAIMDRARAARRRTFEMILASGDLNIPKYVPPTNISETSEKQKLRLQEKMSGVRYYPELDGMGVDKRLKYKTTGIKEDNYDPILQLVNEIYERADWLAEMESLGEGKKHRIIIQGEIAERLRLIKKLEKDKCQKSNRDTMRSA